MPPFRCRRFLFRQQTHAHLLGDQAVVLRKALRDAAANQVAARIADMRHHHAIKAKQAGDDSCAHVAAAVSDGGSGFINLEIGRLHQPLQAGAGRLVRTKVPKSGLQGFNRQPGSDFAAILPAHAVGEGEEPALVAGGASCRSRVAEEVFIVLADPAYVSQSGELEFKHAIPKKARAANRRPGSAEYSSSMNL